MKRNECGPSSLGLTLYVAFLNILLAFAWTAEFLIHPIRTLKETFKEEE